MDVVELHRRTVDEFVARVRAVPAGRWGDATPCTAWTVRELVNHVVAEDRWTAPLLGGSTIAEVGDRFDGDLLGDDPIAAAEAAAAEATAAVAASLPAVATVQLSYGEESADEYVHQLACDHLVHAWDLAVATGGDPFLDADLVEVVAAWFADREDLYRSAGIIAERAPRPPAERSPQQAALDDLLVRSGRDPLWVPDRQA